VGEFDLAIGDTFKATIANDAINEMIQNSKRKN